MLTILLWKEDNVTNNLSREFDYYLEHQKELVKQYKGKVIVLKNCKVLGAYDSAQEAIIETSKKHKIGTFLVQECSPGPRSYTQTYHSRVSFA
jgi:hypothetical protein